MHDAISIAIDVSSHVPQATKDNAFCRESATVFNIDYNFAAHPSTVLMPSNISFWYSSYIATKKQLADA